MKAVRKQDEKLLRQWQIDNWTELIGGTPRHRSPRGSIEQGYKDTVKQIQLAERHTVKQLLDTGTARINVGHIEIDEIDIKLGIKPKSEVNLLLQFH